MFRYLILGLLSDGGAHHGYALAKAYRERSGAEISTGNFYRELQRLAAEGLVRIAANPPGADERRTPYQITSMGTTALEAWLFQESLLGDPQREDDISARALFLTGSRSAAVRQLLERWQEELWMRGKVLERARDTARNRHSSEPGPTYGVLALLLSRRLKYVAADLEFLTEFRSGFETWTVRPSPEREVERPVVVARMPSPEPSVRPRRPQGRR